MTTLNSAKLKSLVTGGAGFIGSHLCDLLLSKGHQVTVIDNLSTGRLQNLEHIASNINFIDHDLSNPHLGKLQQFDYVFHLAGLADIVPSINSPSEYYAANVTGTLNLLESLRGSPPKKIVYAASSSCYGIPSIYPTPETADISPQYPYALTKRLGEELVLHWSHVYDLPAVSTRFFNVFGTRSRTSGTYGAVFGVFLAQKLAGKPYTVVGDGTQVRDFTYVTDVCNGIYLAAISPFTSEIFNIGSGITQSINKLTQLLGGPVEYIPKRPGEPDITHADISKARSMLGYEPSISFEEGVIKVLDNIEYWRSAPVWTASSIADATAEWHSHLSC